MNGLEQSRILLVDDDRLICSSIGDYLSASGFAVTVAHDGTSALECFPVVSPDVVVTDLCMPGIDGLELLVRIRQTDQKPPVIIMTGNPGMESAIEALQHGACDYVLKPIAIPILIEKIRKAIESDRLSRENILLTEMVSLYNITSRLAATHNMDALLDVIFKYGLELTGSQCGAIYLRGDDGGDMVYARQKWAKRTAAAESARYEIAKQVFALSRRLVINEGESVIPEGIDLQSAGIQSLMAIPLAMAGAPLGVLIVERNGGSSPFSPLDINRAEIIASQAGIAISNADLCISLRKKLDELNLVGSFTQEIMGRLDKYELIKALFEKIREQCPVDIIGYLLVRRRYHDFLYWTRDSIEEGDLQEVARQVVASFNETAAQPIPEQRVGLKMLLGQQRFNGRLTLPLRYQKIYPVAWEENTMGALFIGASVRREELDAGEPLIAGLVNQVRIALSNSKLYNDIKENYIKTIKALAIAVDAKDTYTHGHSEKVMTMAEELAREIKEFDELRISVIRDAALLHDIGKIGVPGAILNKAGPLTYEEFNCVMKNHSTLGANIVKDVPFLNELYKLILHHHEHFDGSGYPQGLKGEDIPLGARILHVADAFDAMTSDRPYRASLGHEEAIRRILADSGRQFDPIVVDAFIGLMRRKGLEKIGDGLTLIP